MHKFILTILTSSDLLWRYIKQNTAKISVKARRFCGHIQTVHTLRLTNYQNSYYSVIISIVSN